MAIIIQTDSISLCIDEHGLALTLENVILQLRNVFASAHISHIGHKFLQVCTCVQIEYKSSQLITFWPLSLLIIISFSFTFVQAYAS